MTVMACGTLLFLVVVALALMIGGALLLGVLIPDLLRRRRAKGRRGAGG
jgi:hypothetical protein